jgi:RHS repeat-associated protein
MNVPLDLDPERSLGAMWDAFCTASPLVQDESKIGAAATPVETMDYYPFGSLKFDTATSSYDGEARKYIGQYSDSDGLSYLNARYYSPTQGQFLTEDPVFLADARQQSLQDPPSLNSYSYSEDNPITKSDPNGRQCVYCAGGEVGLSLSAQAAYDKVFGPSSSAVYGGDTVAASIYGFAYPWTLVAPEPIAAVSAAAGNVAQQGLEYLSGDRISYDPLGTQTAATAAFGSQDQLHRSRRWDSLGDLCVRNRSPSELYRSRRKHHELQLQFGG